MSRGVGVANASPAAKTSAPRAASSPRARGPVAPRREHREPWRPGTGRTTAVASVTVEVEVDGPRPRIEGSPRVGSSGWVRGRWLRVSFESPTERPATDRPSGRPGAVSAAEAGEMRAAVGPVEPTPPQRVPPGISGPPSDGERALAALSGVLARARAGALRVHGRAGEVDDPAPGRPTSRRSARPWPRRAEQQTAMEVLRDSDAGIGVPSWPRPIP